MAVTPPGRPEDTARPFKYLDPRDGKWRDSYLRAHFYPGETLQQKCDYLNNCIGHGHYRVRSDVTDPDLARRIVGASRDRVDTMTTVNVTLLSGATPSRQEKGRTHP